MLGAVLARSVKVIAARTAPWMAPPVSWASTRRRSGAVDSGSVLSSHSGVPNAMNERSMAAERPAVNGTPWAPRGPRVASGSISSRK